MPTTRQAHHPSGRVVSARMTEDTIARLDMLAARTGRSAASGTSSQHVEAGNGVFGHTCGDDASAGVVGLSGGGHGTFSW